MHLHLIQRLIESHYKPLILSEKESKETQKIQYKYYIDCFDLIDILKGVKRFSEDNEDRDKISNARTLAYSLILDGWIDNINLLPTHQTEFFDLMYLDFGVRNPHIDNEDINNLIAEYEYEQDQLIKPEENYREYIEMVVDKSIDRFNLFGLSRANNWQKRLQKLVDLKILKLKDYNLKEVVQLVTTDNFRKIKMATDQVRSKFVRKRSNFNDALALTFLSTIKEPNTIPIFLDSKGFYTKIIKKSGFQYLFEYELNLDNEPTRVSIVRDTAYFILKSIFDCPKEKLNVIHRKFPQYFKIWQENRAPKFIPANKVFTSKNLNHFFLEDDRLKRIYDQYRIEFKDYLENEFFNKVWLSCYEGASFRNFISEHYQYQNEDDINKTKVINAYKKSFLSTYRKVKEESQILSVLTIIWANLTNCKLPENFDESNDAFSAFFSYGSFRFSFPFNEKFTIDEINETMAKLMFDEGLAGNIVTKNNAVHIIIKQLFDGLNGDDYHQLSMATAVLWSLKQYQSLDKIFNLFYKSRVYPHYSFALLHATSLLKITTLQHNREKVLEIIKCIEQKIPEQYYKYLIGKAFVFYFLWKAECKDHFSLTLKSPENTNPNFDIAETSASQALKLLKQKDYQSKPQRLMLYLYALNLKIFMITEGGNAIQFKELEESDETFFVDIVDEFKQAESDHPVYWQSRYDDTIARYYLRLAIYYYHIKNTEGFELFLKRAKARIDKAVDMVSENTRNKENLQEKIFEVKTKYENGNLDSYLKV